VAAVAVMAAVLAAWVLAGPDAPTARLTALLAASGARRRLWKAPVMRPRPAVKAAAWRAASIELCQSLVAELAAGKQPGEALARAAAGVSFADKADDGALLPVVAAARDGGDVPAALLRAASPWGGDGLVRLAACWRVSVTVGGDLVALVQRVEASLREEEAHRQDVAAQLAGPRATARMLAGLPVLGVLMAAGLGMDPVAFLLGGPAGIACLITGLALDTAGVWWTRALVARAEGMPARGRSS
jgi:tight adherence protein B